MENITQTTITTTNIATTPPKSSSSPEDHETETPRTQITTKALTFSNGVLKRHHPHHHHHHPVSAANHHQLAAVVTYKECLKNHAAALGGHALDGCGEFMPAPTATSADPASIKCAACGCHRNFHRREPAEDPLISAAIEFQSHNRHQPPPPPPLNRSPNSASPPPISSSYYPHHHHHHHRHRSAPHMLLALSGGGIAAPPESTAAPITTSASPRKRFRTKFTQDQKEKMQKFAEKVGWKIQKRDEDLIQEFCSDVGVDRSVLKVWMHNNKNNFTKKENNNNDNDNNTNNHVISANGDGSRDIMEEDPNMVINTNTNNNISDHVNGNDGGVNVAANGSSSSS